MSYWSMGLECGLELAYQGVNILTHALVRMGFDNAPNG